MHKFFTANVKIRYVNVSSAWPLNSLHVAMKLAPQLKTKKQPGLFTVQQKLHEIQKCTWLYPAS